MANELLFSHADLSTQSARYDDQLIFADEIVTDEAHKRNGFGHSALTTATAMVEDQSASTAATTSEAPPTEMQQFVPWKILIVDNEPEIHQVTKLALQHLTYGGSEVEFLSAYSAQEAAAIMVEYPDVAVVLLDVVMETNHAGLTFVRYLREELNNKRTRIILRTGQPGEAPEEAVIREYDINDYKTKTELTKQKLYTSVLVSLRTYEQFLAFEANQHELEVLSAHLKERNSELQRAKDAAEAASHAKDEFLSLMNHELRTPLNVILMRAEILDNGVYGHLSAKQKKSIEQIRNSGQHLLSIIDDILDLAAIETGKFVVTTRRVSANDACAQSISAVQSMADDKQINMHLVMEPDNNLVYADERRLIQTIEKLLRNAIKFSTANATIGVELTADPSNSAMQITVWDEGIGIASADISRLFQPFVQLEYSLTRRYEGVGLGLSIASRLTQLMGGVITVDSQPGNGSRFTIALPLVTQASANPETHARAML